MERRHHPRHRDSAPATVKLLGKVAWIGELVSTVAEVIVFLTYRPG